MSIIKATVNYDLEMIIKGKYPSTNIKIYENWENKKIRPYSKKDYELYRKVIRDEESKFEFHCDTNNDFFLVTITNPKLGIYVFRFNTKNPLWYYNRYSEDYKNWIDFKPKDSDIYKFSKV